MHSKTVRTMALVNSVWMKIKHDPHHSMQKMAKEASVSEGTIRNIVKKDLGLKSQAVQPVQSLTTAQRAKRLKRSKALINRLKSKPSSKVVIFRNEKSQS